MKSKVVWKRTIDCDGVSYVTSITKPVEYGSLNWQIALHLKVDGLVLHDYCTHFIEGAGQYDGEVLTEQVASIFGRLLKRMPKFSAHHIQWYRHMTQTYFKYERFDFEI